MHHAGQRLLKCTRRRPSLPRCQLGLGSSRVNQLAYGPAAFAIAADAGPCQAPPANSDVTDPNDDAAACNSSANPSQAPAAANSGRDPAPRYIRSELVSGGNHAKPTITAPSHH